MTSFLTLIAAALAGLSGGVVAVGFDLLPERVDLFGFVLQGAGLGALLATALGVIRRPGKGDRARWVELCNAWARS